MDGEGLPGNQWVAPTSPFYVKSVPMPKRNVERAKQLLKEGGRAESLGDTDDADDVGRAKGGAGRPGDGQGSRLRHQDPVDRVRDVAEPGRQGRLRAYILAWSGRADPDGNLFNFYGCKQPLNYSGYCDPLVEELLTKSRTINEPAARMKYFEQIAQKALVKDRPIIYLYHRNWLWAYSEQGRRPARGAGRHGPAAGLKFQ
jgi:peptide/nickel transport system substrate-binding protein